MADVLIAGGGIIGCATAYYLAREGASVTVLERSKVGEEASGAAAGMLAALSGEGERPTLFTQLCSRSLDLFETLLPALAETGIDVYHRRVGVLHIAVGEDEAQALSHLHDRRSDTVPGLRLLHRNELLDVEPEANPAALGGLLVPAQQYVDPKATTLALAETSRRLGVRVVEGEAVTGFLRAAGSVRGFKTDSGTYEGDHVVIAGGPWSMALARGLGAYVPTHPVRGQMLSLNGPVRPLRNMVWGSHAYLVPREDGQTYVGATVEDVGYRKRTTTAGLRALRRGAGELIPALRQAEQRRAWAGLRPGSPDGLPIMGRLPGWSNAWVSTGHFRNGILLAPVSGRLLADSILAGRPVPELEPLSPVRFSEGTPR